MTNKFSTLIGSSVLALGLLAVPVSQAQAVTFTFTGVTNNNATNTTTGQNQLSVDVTDPGAGQVKFTFNNSGPLASSITDVYFDDGALLGIASIMNGSGVDFSQDATPPNLPGGNTIDFNATSGFTADSNPPVQPNGVNPGEMLMVTFNLQAGKDFQDVLDALDLGLDNPGEDVIGGLRIGIHVQGFSNGGSESFVNGPGTAIPEPLTMLGVGTAVGFGTFFKKRLAKTKKN